MALIPVSSSAIAAVGYEDGILGVVFTTSDTVYFHYRVPLSVYFGLMSASSMGAFYNAFIRGRYR